MKNTFKCHIRVKRPETEILTYFSMKSEKVTRIYIDLTGEKNVDGTHGKHEKRLKKNNFFVKVEKHFWRSDSSRASRGAHFDLFFEEI